MMSPEWSRFLAKMIHSDWYRALPLDDQIRLRDEVDVEQRSQLSEWATRMLDQYVPDAVRFS